jgi:hypothetical protein
MVSSRTRLSRSGKLAVRDSRLKSQISSELKGLPTERVKKYATLAHSVTRDSPVLELTKVVAASELARREASLQTWKKGAKAEPFTKRFVRGAKTFAEYAGKGVRAYGKVLSGEAAQELEESIATIGMKESERKKYVKQLRKERAADVEGSFGLYPQSDVPDFRIANVVAEGDKELKRAKREAFL